MAVTTFLIGNLSEAMFPVTLEQLAKIGHLILPSTVDSIDACLNVFGQPGAIFGMVVPYDSSGNAYLEPEDSFIIDDFILWAESANQKLVTHLGAIGSSTGFTMVIDAYTNKSLLKKIYSAHSLADGYFNWDRFLPVTLDLIEMIGWCYIPLPGEMGLAIILVSERNRSRLLEIEALVKSKSMPLAFVDVDSVTIQLR